MRLHLVVMAIGRRVGLVDPDGSRRDRGVGVADRRRDRPQELRRVDSLLRRLAGEHDRRLGGVFDPD